MAASHPTALDCRAELLHRLRDRGHPGATAEAPRVRELLETLERLQPATLMSDSARLRGVWELRWSSSHLPYLLVAPWLENLQVLDPERGRAMNLLRLAGPLGPLGGIAVQARIAVEGMQRVSVRFERGGWIGPRLGAQRLELLREVRQSFPAWLDITVLDDDLRVCRGNAGTLFALVRHPELRVEDLLEAPVGAGQAV
ncbi:MAG: PAP/fibrillin family protein [Cyanobacteriota bacterium]|nr:PAP/fibrillin family protein [Cyanobacteriota bacterium]